MSEQLQGDVTFLGLATSDRPEEAFALIEEAEVSYQVGLDPDGTILRSFVEVQALPATVVINDDDIETRVGLLDVDALTELVAEIS